MKRITLVVTTAILVFLMAACSTLATVNNAQNNSQEITQEISDQMLSEGKLLPIGSVIKPKNAEGLLMIVGKLQYMNGDTNTLYDYSAITYPTGWVSAEDMYMFNQDQIERIYFVGYESEINDELDKKIEQIKEKQVS